MPEENPYQRVLRQSKEMQAEALRLAEELVQTLQTLPPHPVWGQGNWLGLVERWESAETVVGALALCLQIVRMQEPMTLHNLSRQLRRWRREQGAEDLGWLARPHDSRTWAVCVLSVPQARGAQDPHRVLWASGSDAG